jgi:hypothetical protein
MEEQTLTVMEILCFDLDKCNFAVVNLSTSANFLQVSSRLIASLQTHAESVQIANTLEDEVDQIPSTLEEEDEVGQILNIFQPEESEEEESEEDSESEEPKAQSQFSCLQGVSAECAIESMTLFPAQPVCQIEDPKPGQVYIFHMENWDSDSKTLLFDSCQWKLRPKQKPLLGLERFYWYGRIGSKKYDNTFMRFAFLDKESKKVLIYYKGSTEKTERTFSRPLQPNNYNWKWKKQQLQQQQQGEDMEAEQN